MAWTKSNDYLWFEVICIELLLGEVRTRALVPLVVSHNDSDPPSVHVFFLARVLALPFLTHRAGPVVLLPTLGCQEEDSKHEDESSAEDNSSSSRNDHPGFWNGPAWTRVASSNSPQFRHIFSCFFLLFSSLCDTLLMFLLALSYVLINLFHLFLASFNSKMSLDIICFVSYVICHVLLGSVDIFTGKVFEPC